MMARPCVHRPQNALPLIIGLTAAGCVPPYEATSDGSLDWQEFLDRIHREPETGIFIVDGDTPVENEKQLIEFHAAHFSGADLLAVHRNGNVDARWSEQAKRSITYCVSTSFGGRHATIVQAMSSATSAWEAAADVDFIHLSELDGNCTRSTSGVVFDVNPTNQGAYLARAFFPGQSRSSRNILVDLSVFRSGTSVTGVLRHELGHSLGFRHEHTRPEAGRCFEDSSWRPLTSYDRGSVMHYPSCGGTNGALELSALDRQGAAALYGAPNGTAPDPQPEPPAGGSEPSGTEQSASVSGGLVQGERDYYQPIEVAPGSAFSVEMTGVRDPDLYVRFGAAPTRSAFDCRPYLDDANESCELTVPQGQTQAFVMVRGYTASSYTLTITWTGP